MPSTPTRTVPVYVPPAPPPGLPSHRAASGEPAARGVQTRPRMANGAAGREGGRGPPHGHGHGHGLLQAHPAQRKVESDLSSVSPRTVSVRPAGWRGHTTQKRANPRACPPGSASRCSERIRISRDGPPGPPTSTRHGGACTARHSTGPDGRPGGARAPGDNCEKSSRALSTAESSSNQNIEISMSASL